MECAGMGILFVGGTPTNGKWGFGNMGEFAFAGSGRMPAWWWQT